MRPQPTFVVSLLAVAALAAGNAAQASGRNAAVHATPQRSTAPDITPQGRFLYGPSFGHPRLQDTGLVHVPVTPRRRVFGAPIAALVAPLALPYGCSASAFPSFAFSGRDCAALEAAPPPTPRVPAIKVEYVPVPYPAQERKPSKEAASTPIYYCAERHAYTNDVDALGALDCPKAWRRMTH